MQSKVFVHLYLNPEQMLHQIEEKMNILENLISAFSVLRGSKLRTVLTLLGITIGIAGVIAMMSFGAGAENY